LLFGGTSTAALTADVRRAASDPNVSAILIQVHSPGGDVAGVEELAAAITGAAKRKRVVAAVDVMAASAAYWAIAGASEIIASPSAQLGSIGVLGVHTEISKALDAAGIRRTYIASSRFKAEGNETEPLSPEARAEVQRKVDAFDATMTAQIAAGRRLPVERVRSSFGQGRIVLARDAVARGMADRISTLDEALGRLVSHTSGGLMSARAGTLDVRQRRLRLAALGGARFKTALLKPLTDFERRRHRLAAQRAAR